MKCIIFVRVSTSRQDFSEQEIRTSSLAEKDGFPPENQILIAYKESAIKLSEEARLGLSDLKQYILSDQEIKAVYAFEISRIARSQKVLYSIRDFLLEHQVQLCIVTPSIRLLDDTGNIDSGAELAFSLYATMAEQEMRLKKERFRNARERNNKLGRFNGGNISLGFKLNEENVVVTDLDTSDTVVELFRKYLSGWSIVQLRDWLRTLGIRYSGQNIKNMLTRTSYIKIVGETVFLQVQREQERRMKEYGGEDKKRKYSLGEKLIKCPVCGHYFTLRSGHNYSCVYHDCQRKNTEQYCPCTATLSQHRIEAIIKTVATKWYVREMTENDEERKREVSLRLNELPKKMKTLADSLERIEIRKKRIIDDYEEMVIDKDRRDSRLRRVRDQEVEMEDSLTKLKSEYERLTRDCSRPMMTAFDARKRVEEMTQEELYAMVHDMISEITLELTEDGKVVMLFGYKEVIDSRPSHFPEKFRFEGQARYFKLYKVYPDGSEIDVTKERDFN